MYIRSLSLEGFRSYERLEINFDTPQVELLLGSNGSGKTNVVEAISYLSWGRSCLGIPSEHAIRWNGMFLRVRATVQTDSEEQKTLEYVSQNEPTRQSAAYVSDVRTPFAKFVGMLPTVTFLPSDLQLFTGSPDKRRGFLDAALTQLKPGFVRTRLEYDRVLKQRNALLKQIIEGLARPTDLEPWDNELATFGAQLQYARTQLALRLNARLADAMNRLGEKFSTVECVYLRRTEGDTADEIAISFSTLLKVHRERDILMKTTSVGPHRDDWRILVDGHDLALTASRGQQRTALLASLLILVDELTLQRGERPVVLLDDVFSELDERHQLALLSILSDHQVIITATHAPHTMGDDVSTWSVRDGQVEKSTVVTVR